MTGNLRHIALDWLLRIQQSPEDAELRTELATWLAADASHVEAYRKAQRVWQVTGMVQTSPATTTPSHPFAAPAAPPQRPRRRRWARVLAASLAACLVAVIAPQTYLAYKSDYRTGAGEQRTVELDDGSRIRLDSQSAVAVQYSENLREVRLLAGQAFFEVTPDQQRPFTVDADTLQIWVTGTAFNVAMRPDQLAVAVRHGSVRVTEGDNLLAEALTQGERLRLRDGAAPVRDDLPTSQIAAWQQGKLIVRDASIREALEELRPYLPGRLALLDERLGAQRISGVYDLHDPDAALRAIVAPYQGQVTHLTGWLRVVRRQP